MLNEPYFVTNEDWWYYDVDEGIMKLTDKAPQKAIDSYNEYYKPKGKDGVIIDA